MLRAVSSPLQALRGLVVAGCLAAASPVHAQASPNDAALATELFNAGRDLMKEGNVQAACGKLSESARLDPKVGTLARLAECSEKLGQLVRARSHWQQAVNLARSLKDDRGPHAQEELERIDRLVPKLRITMTVPAPAGLTVNVDGAVVGEGSLGTPLPVEPGKHAVTVGAPGKKPWRGTFEVQANGAVTIVAVPALEDASEADANARPTAPAVSDDGPSPLRVVGLVAAGVGVVGVGVGAAFALGAKSKFDESNQQPGGCVGNACPAGAPTDARNDARAAGNVATVLTIAGGALAAGGLTLFLVAPRRTASPRAAVQMDARGARLTLVTQF